MRRQKRADLVNRRQLQDSGLSRRTRRFVLACRSWIRRLKHKAHLSALNPQRTHKVATHNIATIRQSNPAQNAHYFVFVNSHAFFCACIPETSNFSWQFERFLKAL